MTPLKRGREGWTWPKTVLDFVAAQEVAASRARLDELMDALDKIVGGRDVSVTLEDVPIFGEDRITAPELIFVTHVSRDEMRREDEFRGAFYSALDRIAPRRIYYVQLHVLAEHETPEA